MSRGSSDVVEAGASPAPRSDSSVLRWRAAWSGPAGVAAMLVLLVQLGWRGSYLAQGYFTQDDFLMMRLGDTSALGPRYLWQDYAGHLFPGGFVIAFLNARLAPMSWPAAYVPVLLMELGAGILMWTVLSRLLGSRWERAPLLVVFCLSPLSLWSTQWWAVAIQFLPVELCGLGAALGYLLWRQDGVQRARWLPVILMAVGLLFQERGLLIPLVVLAVALIVEPLPSLRDRAMVVLRAQAALWLGFAGVAAGYLVLHAWLAPVDGTRGEQGRQPVRLVANFLFRNVVPGLFGGPWSGVDLPGAAVVPADWVVVVSCGLLVGLVALTARVGGTTALVSWLALLAYLLADAALVLAGRSQFGALSGLTVRYAADTLPILVVALAGAVREVDRWRAQRGALVCLAVAAGYVGSSAVTSHALAPDFFNGPARTYVANLHEDLAVQPDVVLYDTGVPDDVMFTWFLTTNRVSTVIGTAPWAPTFDVPSEQMRTVDGQGHVVPLVLHDPVEAAPGPTKDCGYAVTLTPTVIDMPRLVPFAKNVIELGYYTAVTDVAVVTAGADTVEVPVQPGLHAIDLIVASSFAQVSVRLSQTPGVMCLASVVAGTPEPVGP